MPYLIGAILVIYAVSVAVFAALLTYRCWEWLLCKWWDL